jgi:hypothetical protein
MTLRQMIAQMQSQLKAQLVRLHAFDASTRAEAVCCFQALATVRHRDCHLHDSEPGVGALEIQPEPLKAALAATNAFHGRVLQREYSVSRDTAEELYEGPDFCVNSCRVTWAIASSA